MKVAGTPARDALVILDDRWGPVASQRTRDDGSFDFGLRTGDYRVTAAARDGVPHSAPAAVAMELDLRKCSATVRGHVTDEKGAAIANATASMSEAIIARTDSAGAYELCTEEGEQLITFASPGRGSIFYNVDVVGVTEHDAILAPGVTLEGRVVGSAGQPIVNPLVTTTWRWGLPEGPAGQTVLADYMGRFRMTDLAPSLQHLSATSETTDSRDVVELAVPASGSHDVVVPTVSCTTIRGRLIADVYSTDKGPPKPIAGVMVNAYEDAYSTSRDGGWYGVTGPDGLFTVRYAPLGKVRVRVTEGYSGMGKVIDAVGPAHPTPITIEAGASYGQTYRGRVTFKGRPVAGASVCCPDPTNLAPTYTKEDGTYVLRNIILDLEIEPGYTVHTSLGATFRNLSSRVVTSEDEKTLDTDVLDFELVENKTAISGTVVDEKGAPLVHAWVSCRAYDGGAFTDSRGQFRCEGVDAGPYALSVATTANAANDGQWLAAATPFPVGHIKDGEEKHVALVVRDNRERITIAGRVVDTTGAPVANARVRALDRSRRGVNIEFATWLSLPTAHSNTAGDFSFAPLDTGWYELEAIAPDGRKGVGKIQSPDTTPQTIVVAP